MKHIILMSLMSLAIVGCGNPHVSSEEPPQQMVSPIKPEEETDYCGDQAQQQQQQEQQQQQQENIVLLKDGEISKLAKCEDQSIALDTSENKMNWRFDRPLKMWGTKLQLQREGILQLFNCKEELSKEFLIDGKEERIGFSAVNEEVCSVTLL